MQGNLDDSIHRDAVSPDKDMSSPVKFVRIIQVHHRIGVTEERKAKGRNAVFVYCSQTPCW